MIQPELLDVIELLVELPEHALRFGQTDLIADAVLDVTLPMSRRFIRFSQFFHADQLS